MALNLQRISYLPASSKQDHLSVKNFAVIANEKKTPLQKLGISVVEDAKGLSPLNTPELTFATVCITSCLHKQLMGWQDLHSRALYKYYLWKALEFCSAEILIKQLLTFLAHV